MASGMKEGLPWIGHDELKRSWRWVLGLGIALIVLGLFAVGWSTLATFATVELFGWLLVLGGALSIGHACWQRRWGGFFLDLFAGVLYLVVGFMIVSNPMAAAGVLTLLMAMFFLIGGIFRIIVAVTVPMHHWGWLLLNGAVTVLSTSASTGIVSLSTGVASVSCSRNTRCSRTETSPATSDSVCVWHESGESGDANASARSSSLSV